MFFFTYFNSMIAGIEEGRAARKSPHQKFGYFLSMSQQAVSADIIPNSAVGIFASKQKEQRHTQPGHTDKLVSHKFRSLKFYVHLAMLKSNNS